MLGVDRLLQEVRIYRQLSYPEGQHKPTCHLGVTHCTGNDASSVFTCNAILHSPAWCAHMLQVERHRQAQVLTWTRYLGRIPCLVLRVVAKSRNTSMKPAPMVLRFTSGSVLPCTAHRCCRLTASNRQPRCDHSQGRGGEGSALISRGGEGSLPPVQCLPCFAVCAIHEGLIAKTHL